MLIVEVKEDESIDKALKRYKRKYQNAQIIQEIRKRQQYTKPSVKRRAALLRAVYREQKMRNAEE
jgi:small subunit ribosomal protein S21